MSNYTKAPAFAEENNQKNAAYLYYKKYYKKEDFVNGRFENIASKNNDLLNIRTRRIPAVGVGNRRPEQFELMTIYPGLLLGAGYIHEAKLNDDHYKENAFKLGFYFDYTTGMPVLPGTSVKGVLRSMFPNVFRKKLPSEYRESRKEYIESLLKTIAVEGIVDIGLLEKEIFDGVDANGKNIPLYKRDIFLEAVPVSKGELFGADYITPHKHEKKPELDAFSNPTPIKFLKILPNVVFEFRFILKDSLVYPEITAAKKAKLFKNILLDVGIGAKTNVGYGQFTDEIELGRKVNSSGSGQSKRTMDEGKKKEPKPLPLFKPKGKPDTIIEFKLEKGNYYKAELVVVGEKYAVFKIKDDKGHLSNHLVKATKIIVEKLKKKGYEIPLEKGQLFRIEMKDDSTPGMANANFQVKPPKP